MHWFLIMRHEHAMPAHRTQCAQQRKLLETKVGHYRITPHIVILLIIVTWVACKRIQRKFWQSGERCRVLGVASVPSLHPFICQSRRPPNSSSELIFVSLFWLLGINLGARLDLGSFLVRHRCKCHASKTIQLCS